MTPGNTIHERKLEGLSGTVSSAGGRDVFVATSDRVWLAGEGGNTLVAGATNADFAGDGGTAAEAKLNRPTGVAVAPDGSIYIADWFNSRIRKVDAAGVITTVAECPAAPWYRRGLPWKRMAAF